MLLCFFENAKSTRNQPKLVHIPTIVLLLTALLSYHGYDIKMPAYNSLINMVYSTCLYIVFGCDGSVYSV